MLRYENRKTNSLINIPEEINLSNIEDYTYLIKMMIYNDEKIIKNKMQQLVNCLEQIKNRRTNIWQKNKKNHLKKLRDKYW